MRLYQAAAELRVEGIVANRADSPYRRGRTSDWLKIRTPAGMDIQAERVNCESVALAAKSSNHAAGTRALECVGPSDLLGCRAVEPSGPATVQTAVPCS